MDPSDPDAAAGTPIPGLNITLANIQEALRRGRSQSAENMVKTVEGLENRLVGGGNGGAAAQVIWLNPADQSSQISLYYAAARYCLDGVQLIVAAKMHSLSRTQQHASYLHSATF